MADLLDTLMVAVMTCAVVLSVGQILLWMVGPLLQKTPESEEPACDCEGTGVCHLCGGSGAVPHAIHCPECHGSGLCHLSLIHISEPTRPY